MTPEQRQQRDDRIAELLYAGATYVQILAQMPSAGTDAIRRVRKARGIPVPPGRRLDPQRRAKVEARALELLAAGVPVRKVAAEVGVTRPTITRIRRTHGLARKPVRRDDVRRTVDEAFALYTRTDGEHLLWLGGWRGNGPCLYAEGGHCNPRAIAFERHHGRPPEGRMNRIREACEEPTCIAGAHHTDAPMREARDREPTVDPIDALYDAIFTTGDTL